MVLLRFRWLDHAEVIRRAMEGSRNRWRKQPIGTLVQMVPFLAYVMVTLRAIARAIILRNPFSGMALSDGVAYYRARRFAGQRKDYQKGTSHIESLSPNL